MLVSQPIKGEWWDFFDTATANATCKLLDSTLFLLHTPLERRMQGINRGFDLFYESVIGYHLAVN